VKSAGYYKDAGFRVLGADGTSIRDRKIAVKF